MNKLIIYNNNFNNKNIYDDKANETVFLLS